MAKANNYQKAVAEVEAFDKEAVKLVPEEINEADKGHYNCLMVKRINDAKNQKYVTNIKVQTFDARSFEKAKKSVGVLGYYKMIVLHTPEAITPRIPDDYLGKGAKSEEEIAKEIEAKAEEKANEILAEKMKGVKTPEEIEAEIEERAKAKAEEIAKGNSGTGSVDPKTIDLTPFKLDELKEFAKQNGVDLKGIDAKADVLAALQTWQKES